MKTTSQKKKKRGNKKPNRDRLIQKKSSKQVADSDTKTNTAEVKSIPATVKKSIEKKQKEKNFALKTIDIVIHFLREARLELKKVKWPTRKELTASTVMVLFLVLAIALYLGLIDTGLMRIMKLIVG